VDLSKYVTMAVSFARVPFDCEFCDIIVMNGRTPRTKAPAQVIAELEALRARGGSRWCSSWTTISSAQKAAGAAAEMIAWRQRTNRRWVFSPKPRSIWRMTRNCGPDGRRGIPQGVRGIETPMAASLAECHQTSKRSRDSWRRADAARATA